MRLDPAAIGAGVRLDARDTLGSTNAEALARAGAGEPGPLWITAERQTAGRGRRGRSWVSEPGNLHATLLLTDPGPAERAAELSFVAALAAHDAIAETAPALGVRLKLKWPNDVLIDRAKVAGILIEGERAPGAPLAVVLGIGVNCRHHPAGTAYPATSLAAAGATVGADELFAALSRTMLHRLAQWARGTGFRSIRADWLARAVGLGEDIRVVLGGEVLEGRFERLTDAGHLALRARDGTERTVAAGDVFPLAVARSAPAPASI
jgi:BirA family transcriptional regulator, biotin operon repressor / biotin---[acetyl-CoA-carboxylase] ligase